MAVIEVNYLTKRFGRLTAVEDVTFAVERAAVVGFLGPSTRRPAGRNSVPIMRSLRHANGCNGQFRAARALACSLMPDRGRS